MACTTTVTSNKPIVNGSFDLGDYIDPLMLSVVAKADFDNAAIRCIAVRDSENSVSKQPQIDVRLEIVENRNG